MWHLTSLLLTTAAIAVDSTPQPSLDIRAVSPYAPVQVACPASPLIRKANGIGTQEQAYYTKRRPIATAAFKSFLEKAGAKFPELSEDQYPGIALTSSGGGLRALLTGAGVHLAFDDREGNVYSTSGLYQSLIYEAGLSGGGWLLSSLAANNYPKVSSLRDNLWKMTFEDSTLLPGGPNAAQNDAEIRAAVQAKHAEGFPVSIVDPYGRMIGYTILYGADGGVSKRFSDIATESNFTSHHVPFPIITATGVDTALHQCEPPANATQYEISPYEFGSFDKGVTAFVQTKYIGSFIDNGHPRTRKSCYNGFDNTNFIFGTSSDIFPGATCPVTTSALLMADVDYVESFLPDSVNNTHKNARIAYAKYINPFHHSAQSPLVKDLHYLTLADGGLSNQNNPIWPFLHRPHVNVLFVSDNSADTTKNYPNGSEIYNTFIQAKLQGLGSRMPVIPDADVFVAKGLNTKPTFFGCNNDDAGRLAIAFLPNVGYNGFDSGTSTFQVEYPPNQTVAMIKNGAEVGSYNKQKGFGTCLACLAMKKATAKAGKKLPAACTKCFATFCYN